MLTKFKTETKLTKEQIIEAITNYYSLQLTGFDEFDELENTSGILTYNPNIENFTLRLEFEMDL